MRILAFSDLHGEEAALSALRQLSSGFDHVFICGDISRSSSFAQETLDAFPAGFVIPGNWDNEVVNEVLRESPQWMHGKRAEIGGSLNVVGFGYSNLTPFGTFGELSEEEMEKGLSGLDIDSGSLLMLHTPPKGHFDMTPRGDHAGSTAILKAIEDKKPLAAMFGHIHEHMGTEMLGPTKLIKIPAANSMRACALTIEDRNIDVEFVRL